MKHQYFGDINDYKKYGLLRKILQAGNFQLLIGWMLTPDDNRTDGNLTQYLDNPNKWADYDPELFSALSGFLKGNGARKVDLIENSELLHHSSFFSEIVPDHAAERDQWFQNLRKHAQASNFVFLDPDNGIEVKSKPYGKMESSKFVFWREIEALWADGKSLLIYQHFPRVKREVYIPGVINQFHDRITSASVRVFTTGNVMYLLALQPAHAGDLPAISQSLAPHWKSSE